MTATETKRLFDCLLQLTVRAVLFPERLKPADSSVGHGDDVSSPRLLQGQNLADGDGEGSHYESVMQCQHWTDQELQNEKRILKRYLREQRSRMAFKHTTMEQEHAQLYRLYEAYALLKLFLAERRQEKQQEDAPETQPSTRFLLVQAQLLLYAKYFEKTQQRQVSRQTRATPRESTWTLT